MLSAAVELTHDPGDASAVLPCDQELSNWHGRIANAAANGGGLDVYRAALNWVKQGVPPDNGIREKAKQEIRQTAERHLTDVNGASVLDAIYFSTFPEDAAPSSAELDAMALARDALEYKSFGCYRMDDHGLALIVTKKSKDTRKAIIMKRRPN